MDNPKKTPAELLAEAARRYGRPWKCGPVGQAREVWSHRERRFVVVRDEKPTVVVTELRGRKARG